MTRYKQEVTAMTRYQQGFMNKCAEYGVDYGRARRMLKQAAGIGDALDLLNYANNGRVATGLSRPTPGFFGKLYDTWTGKTLERAGNLLTHETQLLANRAPSAGALDLLNSVSGNTRAGRLFDKALRNTRWLRAAPAIAGTTAVIGIPLALALEKRRQRRLQR